MKWFCVPTKKSEPSVPSVPSENASSKQVEVVPEAYSVASCLPKFPICRNSCGQPLVLRSTPPSETEKVIPAVEVSAPVAVSDQASATGASASASQ